ncbi:phage tail tape measure protein [Candidatus Pacearchaeota archaeon]|nr:phage tail tape measure protein [Candidatus Pacearchaeota archaeon]
MPDKLAEAFVELKIKVDELEKGLKKAEKETESSAQKMAKSVAKIGKAFAAAGLIVGVMAVKVAADFEKSMSSVKAVSGATGKAFEDMTKLAKKMGATTVFTAKESADAMQFLAMAGLNANEIMEALPGTLELAAAGSLSLAKAADLATNVLAGMNLGVEELTRVNDVLAFTASKANTNVEELAGAMRIAGPLAASLGFEIEQVASTLGAMANRGIKAENAGQGLKQMFARLQMAASGTGDGAGKAAKAIQELDVAIADATGKLRPMNDILLDLGEAGISAQQAMDLFGRFTFSTALAAVGAAKEAKELENRMSGVGNEAEGAAKKMAEIKLDNFAGKVTLLKSAWDGFLTALGDTIIKSGAANEALETLTSSMGLMQKAIENNAEATVTLQERQDAWIDRLSKAKMGSAEYKLALTALKNVSNRLKTENEELAKSQKKVEDSLPINEKAIDLIDKAGIATKELEKDTEDLEKEFKEMWDTFGEGARFAADTANDQFTIMAQAGRDFTSGFRRELANTFEDALQGNLKSAEETFNAFGGVVVGVLANIAAEWLVATIAAEGFAGAAALAWETTLGPIVLVLAGLALVIDNFDAINQGLSDFAAGLSEFVNGFFAAIKELLGKLKEVASGGQGTIEKQIGIDVPFFAFADGGIGSGFNPGIISQPTFNAGGNQLAGEAGAEAIVPLKNGAIPVSITNADFGGTSNQPVHVTIELDGKALGKAMFDMSQRKAMSFDPGALLERESIG